MSATPNHTKPTCSIASRRIFRLCTRPHTTASQISTAPTAISTAITSSVHQRGGGRAQSTHSASTSKAAMPSISHSTQNGRQISIIGSTLEVKNGIMRCATATKVTTMKPHSAVRTSTSASAG